MGLTTELSAIVKSVIDDVKARVRDDEPSDERDQALIDVAAALLTALDNAQKEFERTE